MKTFRTLALLACLALPQTAAAQQPVVFAGVSLKSALDEAAQSFSPPPRLSYGGSLTLARQIEQGAPADLFCAADSESMDYAAQRKLIDAASRVDLVSNSLVVVAHRNSLLQELALQPEAFVKALGDGRLSLGHVASVPAGKYARAALESAGLWGAVQSRLAMSENVRAALLYVSRNEAPLGIVYASDAQAESRVKVVARFAASSHPRIVYPCALVAGVKNRTAAQAFLEYLQSDSGRALFAKHGFVAN
jgi:molybdate transport system substrate-binding protein